MHHHQIDEFSVTDFRHTVHEVWRVVCVRRWLLLFPLCIVSSAAFLCSLWVPREYAATTIIKREHDPVFANMMKKGWIEPYEDIRRSLGREIANPAFIQEVLESHDLPEGLARFEDGAMRPESDALRQQWVKAVAGGLSTNVIEASAHRDIIEIALTMRDPAHMERILSAVRDQYIVFAQRKTVDVLKSVESFLRSEAAGCRQALAKLQRRRVEYELKYPGISPGAPDPRAVERSALEIERVNVERKLDDLAMRREALQTQLSAMTEGDGKAGDDDSPVMIEEPNPRHAELGQEVERLEREIAEGKTIRSMTDEHPEIKRNRALLAARREELSRMPRSIMISAKVAGDRTIRLEKIESLKNELADTGTALAGMNGRLAALRENLDGIGRDRALAIEHRPAYLKLTNEIAQLAEQLVSWEQNIAPIEQVLYLEGRDRSVHFATVQAASVKSKPISPDLRLVMMICLGVGLGAAVLCVLLAELIDRSYRTVKQLSTSLGVPVIESIDEIVTAAAHRRQLWRKLVVMPALAALLVVATILAGAMAYISLDHSADFEIARSSPRQFLQVAGGQS